MEGIEIRPRRSVLEQLSRNVVRHEPEIEEAMDAYQEARAKSREAIMLDVKLKDGSVVSFDYSRLAKSRLLPNGTIVLTFGSDEITAEGRNLPRLYTAITEHRARFIQEGTEAEQGLKPEDATHIDSIVIKEGKDEF